MKLQTLLIAAVAVLMACTAFEAQASRPTCGGSTQCATIAGPATIDVKDVVSAGVGLCQTESADVPLFCDATSGISAAGAASFDASGFTSGSTQSVALWIEYNQDVHPCTAQMLVCGFYATLCNDRDTDTNCTNVGDQDDQLWDVYSDTSLTPGCPDKDGKDCGVPTDAGRTVCMQPSVYAGAWFNDQIIVFIGEWVGAVATDNVGAGLSVGTYNIYVTATSAGVGCTDNGSGTTASDGCIWQRDAVDSTLANILATDALDDLQGEDGTPPGDAVTDITGSVQTGGSEVCDDDGGNAVNFDCSAGTAIVVFVVGLGSTTETGCTASPLTAAFPGVPVAADLVSGTTFTCSFTWLVAAVGGCLTV